MSSSYFQSPFHSHILFLRDFSLPFPTHKKETFNGCDFCKEDIDRGTSIYCCEKCRFYIHKSCAGLSQIQHPRHEHPLDLLPGSCSRDFDYRCVEFGRGCYFNLESWSAIRTLWVEKYYRSMQPQEAGDGESRLQLAAHEHPLNSFPARRGNHCRGCEMQISEEEAYGCSDCNFFLHEACAKAPLEIQSHPFHPEHPLHLHCCPGDLHCYLCRSWARPYIGYSCRNCEFFLDLSCVIGTMTCQEADDDEREEIRRRSSVTEHPLHPHPLTSYHSKTGTNISCRICEGKIPSGDFFGCPNCKFFLHESCAHPPMDVIQHHFHPKHTLTYARFPDEKKLECQICESGLKRDSYGYTCETCDFFIHQTCVSAILSDLEKGAGMTVQFSFHEHELKLYYNDNRRKCKACGSIISRETLAYKCFSEGCSFRLHKSCAQLPSRMEHPSHSLHPLALRFKLPNEDDDIRCRCCYGKIRGRHSAFSCAECNFYLHRDCAQKPTLKHPFHDHILFFSYSVGDLKIKFRGDNIRCRACLRTCSFNLFRCWQCDFNLHYECSQLPPTVKSDHFDDQLVLRQSYIEDDLGKYSCDICEKRRDPNKWIYFCDMSDSYKLAAHVECALSPVKLEVIEEDDIITRNEGIKRREKRLKLAQEQVDTEEERLKPLLANLESMRAKLESERAELKELETERAKWIDMEANEEDKSIRREESGSTAKKHPEVGIL